MEPFPEEIIKYLVEYIGSVDELEILRVLGDAGAAGRAVEDIARELHQPVEAVTPRLHALRSRGLIRKQDLRYYLGPEYGSDEKPATSRRPSERVLAEVLQLYRERPVSMIRFVYERCGGPLRNFAEAFRIRKEDD